MYNIPRTITLYKYVKFDKKIALRGLVVEGVCSRSQVMLLRKSGVGANRHGAVYKCAGQRKRWDAKNTHTTANRTHTDRVIPVWDI